MLILFKISLKNRTGLNIFYLTNHLNTRVSIMSLCFWSEPAPTCTTGVNTPHTVTIKHLYIHAIQSVFIKAET